MAYPKGVMEFPVSRVLRTIEAGWSMPQLLNAIAAAISGDGPALTVKDVGQTEVSSEVALIVSTSGSTGAAKDVLLTGEALLSSAHATNEYLGAQSGAIWSLLIPTSHIAGINVLTRSLQLGSVPVGSNERADFSAIVPTQLFRALNGDQELLEHLSSCTSVLVGGGPLAPEIRDQAMEHGIRVVTTYGMTESCGGVVYNGEPLPGVDLRIISGRIAIKAPQLAIGYLQGTLPLDDGYFLTSDLGVFEAGHLEVLGRLDDQIISGGEKLSLGAIDRFLQSSFNNPGIVTFARADGEWGERMCIATTMQITLDEIAERLKREFGRHASPKEILYLEEIPYLALGKPDRKRLENDYK